MAGHGIGGNWQLADRRPVTMRALIRSLDATLRQVQGVFEFSDDETCLFRMQLTHSRGDLLLCHGILPKGAAVLELHIWNEHTPKLPPSGPDLVWANRTRRLLINSLYAVGQQIETNPRLVNIKAVGGVSVLLSSGDRSSGERMIQQLGFNTLPHHNRLGRFGAFWENLYSWWLMWAFNPVSHKHRELLEMQRVEFWMSTGEFLQHYGKSARDAVACLLVI